MWNQPTPEELNRMPRLYETEGTRLEDKTIHQHYFIGGSDWYMAEYDPNDRLFFGYAVLNNDYQNSEWGYSSLDELADINVHGIEVDRDLHWESKWFGNVGVGRGAIIKAWPGASREIRSLG